MVSRLKKLFKPSKAPAFPFDLIVDDKYYQEKYKAENPLQHFKNEGFEKNYNPNPVVNLKFIKKKYKVESLQEFCELLQENNSELSNYFDSSFYLQNNPDVAKESRVAIFHFLRHGKNEHRSFHPSHQKTYSELFAKDVKVSGVSENVITKPITPKVGESEPAEDNKDLEKEVSFEISKLTIADLNTEQLVVFSPTKVKIKVTVNGFSIGAMHLAESKSKRYKYIINIPIIINNEFIFDNTNQKVELVVNDKHKVSSNMLFPEIPVFRLDTVSRNDLSGWYKSDYGDELHLLVDDVFYSSIKANLYRKDLDKFGLGRDGKLGFKISVPAGLELNRYKFIIPNTPFQYKIPKNKIDKFENFKSQSTAKFFGIKSRLESVKKVSIIVPIYNAFEEVKLCIDSVLKNTSANSELILIDDKSPDENIGQLLSKYLDKPNIKVIKNDVNLGYTKTINKGIKLAENNDIVLLNSDTIVYDNWLQSLINVGYSNENIGSVTAVSNNAGAFSVPELGTNELPQFLTIETYALVNRQIKHINIPECPTGNGFCLFIKRDVLNEIGLFDEAKFPRGYGEENEFCMRLKEHGYLNVVASKSFVFHKRSASFKDEKTTLIKEGRAEVDKAFPSYSTEVKMLLNNINFKNIRYNVRKQLSNKNLKTPKKTVLFTISTITGGTPQTNKDLMNAISEFVHPLLLHCNAQKITLYDGLTLKVIESKKIEKQIRLVDLFSQEYDDFVKHILFSYGIDLLHIRHIAWHSLNLPKIASQLNISTIFSLHDFYIVCPNVNLIDENLKHCGGTCTSSEGECSLEIWGKDAYKPKLKHSFVNVWRKRMEEKVIPYVDRFITTSDSAKVLIEATYPSITKKPFNVIPHGRDFDYLNKDGTCILSTVPSHGNKIKMLFPGNIGESKGATFIKALKEADVNGRLEFHFLGTAKHILTNKGRHHGKYNRKEFKSYIERIKPNFIGLFSIWPETYCHTLTEGWSCGIPTITFGMGAVEERINKHGGAWIINQDEPAEVLKKIVSIANDFEDYSKKIKDILVWQKTHIKQNSTDRMAAKYKEMYLRTWHAKKQYAPKFEIPKRIGVFTNNAPTSHIRVREWLQRFELNTAITPFYINEDVYINDKQNLLALDAIFIHRNSINADSLDTILEIAKTQNHKIIFEIDDNLFDVPAEIDKGETYAKYKNSLEKIAETADLVIVSNDNLKTLLSQKNNNVVVVPNALDELKWLKPTAQLNLNLNAKLKLLYMGNSTHGSDLALLEAPIKELKKQGHDVELFLIGGISTWLDEEDPWYTRINIPEGMQEYEAFVPWLRSIAHNFDVGLAPLVNNEFCKFKSPLKYLQYSALGLPTIASNIEPYNLAVTNQENGLLIDNEYDNWYGALFSLIDQQHLNELKEDVADNALKTLCNQHLIKVHMGNYKKMLNNLFND